MAQLIAYIGPGGGGLSILWQGLFAVGFVALLVLALRSKGGG